MTSFSDWVRSTRRARNWTLVEVADRAGIKQPVWSQWESGKAVPRRETVIKIADALMVPREDALLRAGYLPGAEHNEAREGVSPLSREIDTFLLNVPEDRRPTAEHIIRESARTISEALAR